MMMFRIFCKCFCIVYDGICHQEVCMLVEIDWEKRVKSMLKAELKRRNISYYDLSVRLGAIGIEENEPNIRNKISRGKFTAVFLLQCLTAIEAKTLRLEDD